MDQKEKLLGELTAYLQNMGVEGVPLLSDGIIKILSDYDIVAGCKDIVPIDDEDERILKRYTACLRLDGKSEKTVQQYIRACRKLRETIGKPFRNMGTYDIRYHLALEKERGISSRSLENNRAYLSAFFQWMTDEELIDKNPILKITPIKYPEELRLPFSDIEIDCLRGACQTKKERAIVELLLSSGIRVSELTNMRVEDINFQSLEVQVKEGKGGQGRMTFTTAVSAKHIQDYLRTRPEAGGYLFQSSRSEQYTTGGIRYILNVLAERAGVSNVHPHRFRRTFATNLATRGMDIQDIQVLLGHKRIDTTMTYVCVSGQKVRASYQKYIV